MYAAWWRESMVAVKRFNRAADSIHELRMHTAVGTSGQEENVVALRGYCRRDDAVFLVMEYFPRVSLFIRLWVSHQRSCCASVWLCKRDMDESTNQVQRLVNQSIDLTSLCISQLLRKAWPLSGAQGTLDVLIHNTSGQAWGMDKLLPMVRAAGQPPAHPAKHAGAGPACCPARCGPATGARPERAP